MKAPLSWLRDFAPFPSTAPELADTFNAIGLIVDGVDVPGREIGGVVTVRVLGIEPHPNADKLTLVDIETGSGQDRVVCGAKNFAVGDVVPWAAPGSELPGGFKLEARRIRGELSQGMLASAKELGLSDDHSGIMILNPETALGQDIRTVLGLDDVVFDLEITPNRPDAMSIAGIARDLAAALHIPFSLSAPADPGTADLAPVGDWASLVVEAADRCPRYVARTGRVVVGPSPDWMAQRLVKAGMRPISNVVDVTNYVMLERGQPLHAFDLGLLGARGIVVRMAAEGETITTLDDVERTLTAEDLLICDANRVPQAIAGVMGGGGSEVSEVTTEVLLESAYFTGDGILRTSKRLGLRTESSARFERGVDPNGVATAADRAWDLFGQVASGQAAPGTLDAYPAIIEPRRVPLRVGRVNTVLGTDLDADRVRGYLEPIGLTVSGPDPEGAAGDFIVAVPTYRPDIEREIDLIEEVARHFGYNNIVRTLPRMREPGAGLTPVQRGRRLTREALVGAGLDEATTFSLLAASDLTAVGLPGEGIELENPLRAEESLLRPSLLPGLLRAVAFNAGQGQTDVGLFEVGHVFLPPLPGQTLPDEREYLGVIAAGQIRRRPHEDDRPIDGHDAVGYLDTVLAALELAEYRLEPADRPPFAPGRAAALIVDGASIGAVGEIDPAVLTRLGLAGPVAAVELDFTRLLAAPRRERRFVAPSRFPASTIDLAFVLDEAMPAGAAQATLQTAAGPLCEEIGLFDVFRSDTLGAGRKSLAFNLRFRAPDRTLTDADVAALRQTCIEAMAGAHGAVLRG